MGISEFLTALALCGTVLVGPFLWVFYKSEVKFEKEELVILLRQKETSKVVPFGEFCLIKRGKGKKQELLGTNHDALWLFYVQKQILNSMMFSSGLMVVTCIFAFFWRAMTRDLNTLPDFVYSDNLVPPSVIMLIASFLVFIVTISAGYRYKKGVEKRIRQLREPIK